MSNTPRADHQKQHPAGVAASAIGLAGGMVALIGAVIGASGSATSIALPLAVGAASSGLVALFLRFLMAKSAKRPMVFISYSHESAVEAKILHEAIRRTGARTWLDFESIRPGETWRYAIESAVRAADVVLVIGPEDRRDEWPAAELVAARRLRKRVLFVQVKHSGDRASAMSAPIVSLGSAEGPYAVANVVVWNAKQAAGEVASDAPESPDTLT